MIILDKPYVSDYLLKTIIRNSIPVLKNEFTEKIDLIKNLLIDEESFKDLVMKKPKSKIYSPSENAIGWISKQLSFTHLPQQIEVFKNKFNFRELIKGIYPDFFYRRIPISELDEMDSSGFPFPFIIKPAVGFFSMGVYRVDDSSDWEKVKTQLKNEISNSADIYPPEVFNSSDLIVEQYIDGEEYAFDAYFDESGSPTVLNSYKHYFADKNDVSDRVYYTSKEIIHATIPVFTDLLQQLSKLLELKNFPIHIEVRIAENGKMLPIEANPFRFGGWCTTADVTEYALGYNPYEYFLQSKKPDWEHILSQMNDSYYSIIVLNNSTGVDGKRIHTFNYTLLQSVLKKILELRKVDFKTYPVFGFLFAETPKDSFSELEQLCKSSLIEYITIEN